MATRVKSDQALVIVVENGSYQAWVLGEGL